MCWRTESIFTYENLSIYIYIYIIKQHIALIANWFWVGCLLFNNMVYWSYKLDSRYGLTSYFYSQNSRAFYTCLCRNGKEEQLHFPNKYSLYLVLPNVFTIPRMISSMHLFTIGSSCGLRNSLIFQVLVFYVIPKLNDPRVFNATALLSFIFTIQYVLRVARTYSLLKKAIRACCIQLKLSTWVNLSFLMLAGHVSSLTIVALRSFSSTCWIWISHVHLCIGM